MLEKAKRQCAGAVIFSVIALIVAIFSITGNGITILLIWVSYTGIRYFKMRKVK